jgi:hypothetical protein
MPNVRKQSTMRRTKRARLFTQGDLSADCGLYAIAHAIGLCAGGLTKKDYERVFALGVLALERQGALRKAMTVGMTNTTLRNVLREVARRLTVWELALEVRLPFKRKKPRSAALFGKVLSVHLSDGAAAVLIRFSGPDGSDHFTTVKGVSRDSLLVVDSLGMTRLPWRSLTISNRQRDKYRYYVHPRATIFLRLI